MTNIEFIVGGVVRDDDYFFHKKYVNEVWELLKSNNIILLSPRRTGKTSLMRRLDTEPAPNYKIIHLNVEDLKSPDSFYLNLLNTLNEDQPEYFKKLSKGWDFAKEKLSKIEELGAISFKVKLRQDTNWEKNWENISQDLMSKIAQLEDKVLFIIDEFPDMLDAILKQDRAKAITFLHHFRKMRLDFKMNNIRWLIGGSVNIKGVLNEENLINTINDFHIETLPNIDDQEVESFISTMLTNRKVIFNQDIFGVMRDLLGEPMPYFLQLFTQELYRYWRKNQNKLEEIGVKEVKEVFNHTLLGDAAQDKLQHFHSRIKLYYPSELQEITFLLLNSLSQSNIGISKKQLYTQYANHQQDKRGYTQDSTTKLQDAFKGLLLRLESDFYIYENNGVCSFKTHLIKIWWCKNWAEL